MTLSSRARSWLLSTSTFTKFTGSWVELGVTRIHSTHLRAENFGAIILHGPHQVAEKFIIDGFSP